MPLRLSACQRAGVPLRPDRRDRVDGVDLPDRGRRDEVELLFRAVPHQDLRQLLELDVRVRERARPETGPVELDRERHAHVRRVDSEDLPRLQPEGVSDDQLAEAREPWVGHQTPTRSTRLMKSFALPVFIVERILMAMT